MPADSDSGFNTPPVRRAPGGALRRVGVEIEYAGVPIEQAAEALARLLDARIDAGNPFCLLLASEHHGDFRLEVDARVLKERRYLDHLKQLGVDASGSELREWLEQAVRSAVSVVVPHELVTPPLSLDDLPLVERLREALRAVQARGTGESVLYGFGLHLNPELPAHDVDSLVAHLRAFVLLREWIIKHSGLDWSRRLGPHVRPWPDAFIKPLMESDYAPSRSQLVEDYVSLVGSRNHELDMLPALVHLEGDELLARVDEPELVQGRPTFHFRLPDCQIGDPDWRVARAWNAWVEVERLAADGERLRTLLSDWRSSQERWLAGLTGEWARHIEAHMAARHG